MLHATKIGIGIATIGMALALVPAVSASASVRGVTSVRSVEALQTSSLCKAYKSDAKAEEGTEGTALVKAMESGNWAAAQKAMLAAFGNETTAEKEMVAALSSAPSKVKSAASVILKFDGTLKGIIEKSTSITSFSTAVESAETSPKIKSALSTLDAYARKLCPGEVPTTTPTT
ncbi:MAG: hypothetical protein ACLPVF_17105 [Acidimicrobiales bacterium]